MQVLKASLTNASGTAAFALHARLALVSTTHPRHCESKSFPGYATRRGLPARSVASGLAQSASWHRRETESASERLLAERQYPACSVMLADKPSGRHPLRSDLSVHPGGVQRRPGHSQRRGDGAGCPSYWVNYY